MKKTQSLNGFKFEPLTVAQRSAVKGGGEVTTVQSGTFQGMCQQTSLGGSKVSGADTPTPTTITWSSDTIYTDGNGARVGAVYHQ
jgi:hypothetical protein